MCNGCYKRGRCLERDEYGTCSEYRNIGSIKAEIEAVMQSAKSSGVVSPEDGEVRQEEGNEGNQKATEGILLGAEVQEADKDTKGEIEDGWSRYFRHSTVNAVVRGRHTVHHKSADRAGSDADTPAGRADDHSG